MLVFAPLEGWRHVKATARHTKGDWAQLIKELVDEHYPEKAKIIRGMDNLKTHKLGSLYEAFEPARAHRIAARLGIHYTPKHGSWLNMAEIEIGIRARRCLNRRLPDQDALKREINAWPNARNYKASRADWRVTTADARIRSKSLYPSVQSCRTTRRIWVNTRGGGMTLPSRFFVVPRYNRTVPSAKSTLSHVKGRISCWSRQPV